MTRLFDPSLDPTQQGFIENGNPAYKSFDAALGVFQILDASTGHLAYSKSTPLAGQAVSLSCTVTVGTGASTAGPVGVQFLLDAGLGGTGAFAGRLELWCGYAPDAAGLLIPVLGMMDQTGQLTHTAPFDWKAGGSFVFGRSATGDAFLDLAGARVLTVPAAQLAGPQTATPTLGFGCPVDAASALAKFGAIDSSAVVTIPVAKRLAIVTEKLEIKTLEATTDDDDHHPRDEDPEDEKSGIKFEGVLTGADAGALDPTQMPVSFKLTGAQGEFYPVAGVTMPIGSGFVLHGSDFKYQGGELKIELENSGSGSWAFEVKHHKIRLPVATYTPVTVLIEIGDYSGSVQLALTQKGHKWKYSKGS